MDAAFLRDLQLRLAHVEAGAVSNRIAVVATTSPLTVAVAGGTPVPAKKIAGITIADGDVVLCQSWSAGLIVIGAIE